MRELFVVEDESTETFFVLRDEDGVRYQLSREALSLDDVAVAEPAPSPEPETVAEPAPTPEPEPRALPEPDPLYATPLSMRPNEIQARIRAGASPAELAEEMGVAESRIEAYAHPVMLERGQIAEAAKRSHPVREDGPAKLTLFEILATAFAARGHSLQEAQWDATREPGDEWVVHLRWQAGLTDNEATWSFHRQMGASPTTEARNPVAADLTDPDFVQPVRSLTAVDTQEPEAEPDGEPDEIAEGDFLRHPDGDDAPQKRRRKAITPHWEDVLLGVRTNTKRPKK